jgi:polyhydroxybutyrate depolymerase
MTRLLRIFVRSFTFVVVVITSACSNAGSRDASTGNTATANATSPAATEVSTPTTTATTAACTNTEFGGDRPVRLEVASTYDCRTGNALLIVLHGYTGNGPGTIDYFGIKAEAEKRGFLYLGPNGTKDSSGNQFWNASSACCDFAKTAVDDSAYLSKLIDDVGAEWNVDRNRVYVLGHSNGGFMAYRMGCEHRTQIAAIASLAGAMPDDIATCPNGEEVSVLQIHGSADETISFEGGSLFGNPYPSAKSSVLDWVESNGCDRSEVASARQLDLVSDVSGTDTTETTRVVYSGCNKGTAVELWTINDGVHTPKLSASFAAEVLEFFVTHPKQ